MWNTTLSTPVTFVPNENFGVNLRTLNTDIFESNITNLDISYNICCNIFLLTQNVREYTANNIPPPTTTKTRH